MSLRQRRPVSAAVVARSMSLNATCCAQRVHLQGRRDQAKHKVTLWVLGRQPTASSHGGKMWHLQRNNLDLPKPPRHPRNFRPPTV
jgi:hypothetical protein